MVDDDQIEIEIVLDDGSIKKGFARINREGAKSGKKISQSLGRGLGSLRTKLLALGSAFAAAFAGRKILAAAKLQEDAVNALNVSLQTAGTYSAEASMRFQEFASAMQQVSVFGDEVILQQAALARNFTKTNEEAEKLTKAAIELSAATGMSLDSAVKNLGKSYSGLSGELGESVTQIRELTTEQLKAGGAIDLVLSRFGGSALGQLNTFGGAVEQLSNLFGDLLEEIGFIVTKSPALVSIFNMISGKLKNFVNNTKDFAKTGDVFGEFVKKFVVFGQTITKWVIAPLELVFNLVNTGFNAVVTAASRVVSFLARDIAKFFDLIGKDKIAENLRSIHTEAEEMVTSFAEKTKESAENVFDFSISSDVSTFLTDLQTAVETAKPLMDDLKNKSNETAESTGEVLLSAGDKMDFLKRGLTSGFAALGGALAKGENGFKAFGNAVLGIVGDLAINLGQTLLTIGLGVEKLKASLTTLTGGFAIAAGLALITLGGALKALGGGGLGTAAAGSGAGAGDQAAAQGEALIQEQDVDEGIDDRASVVVNVEGSLIGTTGENLGLEISNILLDSGFASGTQTA